MIKKKKKDLKKNIAGFAEDDKSYKSVENK